MRTSSHLLLLAGAFLACACHRDAAASEAYGAPGQIDSLLARNAGKYDVAAFLDRHPEQLDIPTDSPTEGYSVKTSPDGNFRVYSIPDQHSPYLADVDNLFLYRVGTSPENIHLRLDVGDHGYVKEVGMLRTGDRTYYVLVSELVTYHQATYVSTTVSVYSLERQEYDTLEREPLFRTAGGRRTDLIEVRWDDVGADRDWDNLFGIALDDPEDTREVYVQVIDGAGDAHDQALVYRWDGRCFSCRGTRPMRIERPDE